MDLIDGKCVRLSQGNYSQCKIYAENPVDVAKAFAEAGITRLHLVDLDGAKSAGVVNLSVLEEICRQTALSVDFGGGVKSDQDIQNVFDAGAEFVCVGSLALTDPEKTRDWFTRYGGEKLILGADVWNTKICIQGWKKVTDTTIFQLLEQYRGCVRYLMCTDITRDGMLNGPAVSLYRDLLLRYPELQLIASGGVGNWKHLETLVKTGVQAVVVGKAIYERKIRLDELKNGVLC